MGNPEPLKHQFSGFVWPF
ncbi:hypothetical protein, partial [Kingella kingae]